MNSRLQRAALDLLRAQAYVILGDFGRAIALLERQRRSEKVERLLAEVYSSWLVELTRRGEKARSRDLALLEDGLARFSLRPDLLEQIVAFSQAVSQDSLEAAFLECGGFGL